MLWVSCVCCKGRAGISAGLRLTSLSLQTDPKPPKVGLRWQFRQRSTVFSSSNLLHSCCFTPKTLCFCMLKISRPLELGLGREVDNYIPTKTEAPSWPRPRVRPWATAAWSATEQQRRSSVRQGRPRVRARSGAGPRPCPLGASRSSSARINGHRPRTRGLPQPPPGGGSHVRQLCLPAGSPCPAPSSGGGRRTGSRGSGGRVFKGPGGALSFLSAPPASAVRWLQPLQQGPPRSSRVGVGLLGSSLHILPSRSLAVLRGVNTGG